MKKIRFNKGIILVFIIGILSILVVVSVVGYNLATVSKKVSTTEVFKTKAEFAAESGLQYSLANIFKGGENWIYWGEDFNKNYQLDEGEDLNNNGILDTQNAPLDGKHLPSLHSGTIVLKDNKTIHYSGQLPGTDREKIIFILKIVDQSNKISVATLNPLKNRFLSNLCALLNINIPQHFSSFEEIKNSISYTDLLNLGNYVSFTQEQSHRIVVPSINLKEGTPVFTRLQLLPADFKEYEIEFLNINSAPPLVLKANLISLESLYFEEDLSSYKLNFTPSEIGVWDYWKIIREKSHLIEKLMNLGRSEKGPVRLGTMKKYTLASSTVDFIIDRIVERRINRVFSSYKDFYSFLSDLTNSRAISELDRDIIFSNLHPNPPSSVFNQFPDILLKINKENILNPTLPAGFSPMGTFSIESLGMVIDTKKQEILATDIIKASAKLQDLISYRTYDDFNKFVYNGIDIYPFSKEFAQKMKVNLNSFLGLAFYESEEDKKSLFYASAINPKKIEVDNEELLDLVPPIYKTYTPFFTTEGIYSGQGHLLKIPATVLQIVSLKDIAHGMIPCDKLKELFGINLGRGCGEGIKGSISFLYKPLFDTINSKKARTILSLNRINNNSVSSLYIFPYVSRKFWGDYFPVLQDLSIGAPAWVWQSYRIGFYVVASINKTKDPEVIMQGKWTHFKLVFDSSNYINPHDGAKIYINSLDASKHIGFTTTLTLSGSIFGVPDYFTDNYLRFGENYKAPGWNFPQDGLFNKIKVSTDIDPPTYREMQIIEDTPEKYFILPPLPQRKFITSLYVETFSPLQIAVEVLNDNDKVIWSAKGENVVYLNQWLEPGYKLKISFSHFFSGFPIISGIVIGTLKDTAEYIEYVRPTE